MFLYYNIKKLNYIKKLIIIKFFFSNNLIIWNEGYVFTWYRKITFIFESILLHYIMKIFYFIIFYN